MLSTATFDNVTVNGFTYTNPPPVVVLTAPATNATLHRRRECDHQRRCRRAVQPDFAR